MVVSAVLDRVGSRGFVNPSWQFVIVSLAIGDTAP